MIYSLPDGKEHACYLNIFCDYLYKNFKRYTTFYLLDNDSLTVQDIIVNCPSFLLYFYIVHTYFEMAVFKWNISLRSCVGASAN